MSAPDRIWVNPYNDICDEPWKGHDTEYVRKDWLVEQIDILKQEASGASAYEAETALAKVCALLCTIQE